MERKNLASLWWMLAVESVASAWFPEIFLATSKTTIADYSLTCAASCTLAFCCLAAVLTIKASPPTSTKGSYLAVPSNCSAADVLLASNFSCVGAHYNPGTCRAAGCVFY